MPLIMEWTNTNTENRTTGNITKIDASSEYRSQLSFIASGQYTDAYICTVRFSYPTSIAIRGIAGQHREAPNGSFSSPTFASKKVLGKI